MLNILLSRAPIPAWIVRTLLTCYDVTSNYRIVTMPGSNFENQNHLWGQSLSQVIPSKVPESRLDDMVRRILASWYYLGQDKGYPRTTINSWKGGTGGPNVQGEHMAIARTVARDGIVLLKNDGNILPLKSAKSIAIIGQDGFSNPKGPNSCPDRGCNIGTLAMGYGSGTAEYPVSFLFCLHVYDHRVANVISVLIGTI